MTFPHLPGIRNYQRRANLERAFEEVAYYSRKLWAAGQAGITAERLNEIKTEIENAKPETAGAVFSKAWQLCQNFEKILQLAK
jgi:hypothetical protein